MNLCCALGPRLDLRSLAIDRGAGGSCLCQQRFRLEPVLHSVLAVIGFRYAGAAPTIPTAKAPATISLSGLYHTASILAVYASQHASLAVQVVRATQDSLPAGG